MGVPVVTGYYRFTDVFFEWHKALPNQEDLGPLRAIISSDALVHPDHPLRKPGQDGIELYIATFANGESRPVFSLAQLEFIQQWLFAMGLTKEPIPLPSTDSLILPSDVVQCSPQLFNDAAALKTTIKTIDKSNKRLKGAGTLLMPRRFKFERVRTLWTEKVGTWLAIDLEQWEYDHTALTELGWSLVRWEAAEMIEECGHFIVKENMKYVNHNYVQGNRDYYDFGTSEIIKFADLKTRLGDMIRTYTKAGPLFLVFHDGSQDLKYLQSPKFAAPISNCSLIIPDATPKCGMYIVDTTEMFGALENNSTNNKTALQTTCIRLDVHKDIKLHHLHNAGNDAHATLLCLKSMALGDSIDVQREKRWPGQMSSTDGKVVHSDEKKEEDDTENMFSGPGDDADSGFADGEFPAA